MSVFTVKMSIVVIGRPLLRVDSRRLALSIQFHQGPRYLTYFGVYPYFDLLDKMATTHITLGTQREKVAERLRMHFSAFSYRFMAP